MFCRYESLGLQRNILMQQYLHFESFKKQVSTLVDALKMDLPNEKVIQNVNFILLKLSCDKTAFQ